MTRERPVHAPAAGAFHFLDPGALVDGELELVAPGERWVDAMAAACRHPLTRRFDPEWCDTPREQLLRNLSTAPGGREMGDAARGRVPAYHFWMRLQPEFSPAVPMAGTISLRVGTTAEVERYYGHVGYNVFPPARGRRYAARATRLLFDLARAYRLDPLWITTGPENLPSRRTCERLGGVLVETVAVPADHPLYARGQRHKCRYRIALG